MLKLAKIKKRFGSKVVLDEISLEINDGEFFCLLGPSGCGKTTLLKIIAGLSRPDQGDLYFKGTRITDQAPQKRDCSFVFQSHALLPHLSVFENVAFPLVAQDYALEKNPWRKLKYLFGSLEKKITSEEIHEVYGALALVHLENFANARVQTLSGGEAQRVALARALVTRPRVVLMDEPLANLDMELKIELRQEIKRIHREVGLTFIYVTHDQQEALELGSRIALMRGGRLEQIDSPLELVRHPKNSWAAKFLGVENIWKASVLASANIYNKALYVGLWAKDLKVLRNKPEKGISYLARAVEVAPQNPHSFKARFEFFVNGEGFAACAELEGSELQELKLALGAELYLSLDAKELMVWEN